MSNLKLNRCQLNFLTYCIGDPSCDLAIAWTLFKSESREAFYKTLDLDKYTWQRARVVGFYGKS